VWNRAVSERVRRYGTKVLVGDLVATSIEAGDLLEKADDGEVVEGVGEEVKEPLSCL